MSLSVSGINSFASDEVRLCVAWLRYYARPADEYCKLSSYDLAWKVRFWAGEYVSNASLIEAAESLGYRVERRGSSAFFRMEIK